MYNKIANIHDIYDLYVIFKNMSDHLQVMHLYEFSSSAPFSNRCIESGIDFIYMYIEYGILHSEEGQ